MELFHFFLLFYLFIFNQTSKTTEIEFIVICSMVLRQQQEQEPHYLLMCGDAVI